MGSWRNTPYVVIQNVGAYLDIPRFLDSDHAIENAADAMLRLHGEKARDIARETAKQTRGKRQPALARYWSLVAIAISRRNDLDFPPPAQ